MDKEIDDIDRGLINKLQTSFPIDREPFVIVGRELRIDGEEVVKRIERLKSMGIVRKIGPVLNARRIGYQITLVAAKVDDKRIDRAGEIISEHSGIGHCYKRDHNYNLWSTLALPNGIEVKVELDRLKGFINAEVIFDLPKVKTFKIGAYFNAKKEGCSMPKDNRNNLKSQSEEIQLSHIDRMLINELQNDLPLVQKPFDVVSECVGIEVDKILDACKSFIDRGIIRRYAASIRHQSVGYVANAMVCWNAPSELLHEVGEKLAALPSVSHCYERRANQYWPYNLFSMMHAYNKDTCYEIADKASRETGINDYVLLFSTKEYKKARIIYKV